MPRRQNALDPDLPKGVHVQPMPGITAQILTQDKAAFPNYPSPDPETSTEEGDLAGYYIARTITTYIAVTNNTPFSIHLRVDRPYPKKMDCSKLQFQIFVDGKFVWDSWCHRPRYDANGNVWEEIIGGMKLGKGRSCEVNNFKFMGLKTTDENLSYTANQRIKEAMDKIGKIEIKVFRTMYGKKGGDVANSKKGFLDKKTRVVPEKALKGADAKSHGTALNEGRRTSRGDVWRDAGKHGDLPIAIFRFLYRSEASLKAMHIIDRTPVPSRSSSPESDHLTPAEQFFLEELRKRERRNGESSSRKRVKREDESSGQKRIKREDDEPESSERAAKRRRVDKGKRKAVTVDLTGDSEDDDEKGPIVISDDEEPEVVELDKDSDEEPEVVDLYGEEMELKDFYGDDEDDGLFVRDD